LIIQALSEYYDRMASEKKIAKSGWISVGLDFLLCIDIDGNIKNIEDLREKEATGKKFLSKILDLPNIGKQALKHTNSGKDANLLWDNASFVFGLGKQGDIRLQSMLDAINEWIGETNDPGINAIKLFFQKGLIDRNHFQSALEHMDYGEELRKGNAKLTFRVLGTENRMTFQSPFVSKALEDLNEHDLSKAPTGTCMVTGISNVAIETTHPVIKGVWGAQSTGACIVSFNASAFESYGKTQSLNAPISKDIVSKYGKALNTLLGSTNQRMQIGDASTVFWSEKENDFEKDFSSFFKEPDKDDPEKNTYKIRSLLNSLQTGAYIKEENNSRFYLLGLSPNSARISVRFWSTGPIGKYAENISQYFNEFEIVKPPKEQEYYSIWRVLVNIATQDKSENIPPILAGDFMRSIIEGTPYPSTLLQAALRRIKSDTEFRVKPVRAALIKAYLNRYYRFYPDQKVKEIFMSLDISQLSIGYQLGRLFAVLEKIQETANPGLNTTIRERYYGAACATPVSVYPILLKLKNHHLAKLDQKGRVVYYEKLLGEVMGKLSDFPSNLDLHEQGRFAIGYYHQRQAFFVSKEADSNSTEDNLN